MQKMYFYHKRGREMATPSWNLANKRADANTPIYVQEIFNDEHHSGSGADDADSGSDD